MKAIGLIRVSTAVQDLQQQTEAVRKEMIKDGYSENDIILIEDKESAVSLSEEERHGLNKMKEYIEADSSINCVYVFELSRLSRRQTVLHSLKEYFTNKKVNLICLKPYFRLLEDGMEGQMGNMAFTIYGMMAEQEGYLRKERTQRGKRKVQLEGKSLGNWLPLGYTTDSERHIIVDTEKANLVRKIFTMCVEENKSTVVIARELTQTGEYPLNTTLKCHSSSIRNILHNTAYIGHSPYNKKRQKESYNQYPPLIPTELFNKAQVVLAERQKQPKTSHKNIYYCKGLLRDKKSGYILSATPAVASYGFCGDKLDKVKVKCITVPINLFDSFAWHLTIQYNKNNIPADIEKMRSDLLKEINNLDKKVSAGKKKLTEFERQINKIQERIIFGKLSEPLGDSMLNKIYQEQEELRENISKWELDSFNKNSYYLITDMIDDLGNSKDVSSIVDDEKRAALIHEAIKEIVIEKGGLPEKGRIRKRGLGVKYGVMEVHYVNGLVEQYKFNSYTKKCFTMNDIEVPYLFELRIKGQQHQPDYKFKNKEMRDRIRKKKEASS